MITAARPANPNINPKTTAAKTINDTPIIILFSIKNQIPYKILLVINNDFSFISLIKVLLVYNQIYNNSFTFN